HRLWPAGIIFRVIGRLPPDLLIAWAIEWQWDRNSIEEDLGKRNRKGVSAERTHKVSLADAHFDGLRKGKRELGISRWQRDSATGVQSDHRDER
ncbi:MAG TPA: hypothetical protein VGC85_07315, partial [Chthoniobacterales bacterium]